MDGLYNACELAVSLVKKEPQKIDKKGENIMKNNPPQASQNSAETASF